MRTPTVGDVVTLNSGGRAWTFDHVAYNSCNPNLVRCKIITMSDGGRMEEAEVRLSSLKLVETLK